MSFYYVIPFTVYAVIVQRRRIDTFSMCQPVMQLVAGTFCYENVVMHILRMAFHSNVESVTQTDARVDIDQRTHYNSFSWHNRMSPEMM